MHSGPVTGGFLRGKGARFQLFGDTMATAQLVLANTLGETVQMSEATANLMKEAGKTSWIVERDDKVETLEKGIMTTYYLQKGTHKKLRELGIHTNDASSMGDSEPLLADDMHQESQQRWIEFNAKLFENLLRQIVARRTQAGGPMPINLRPAELPKFSAIASQRISNSSRRPSIPLPPTASMPLEEVKTIIELPEFDKRAIRRQRDNKDVQLPQDVFDQLRDFITEVAEMVSALDLCVRPFVLHDAIEPDNDDCHASQTQYNDNPFHNFAHASYGKNNAEGHRKTFFLATLPNTVLSFCVPATSRHGGQQVHEPYYCC